jgi:hypothetical protein
VTKLNDQLRQLAGVVDEVDTFDWCTSWTTDAGAPAGANASGNVVDAQLSAAVLGYSTTGGRAGVDSNVEACVIKVTLHQAAGGRVPEVDEPFRLALNDQLAEALGVPLDDRPRFTGEVDGVQLDDAGNVIVSGVGRRARLGSINVGDAPWPAELDGARVQRVLDLAHAQLGALQPGLVDVGSYTLLPRDVDRQPALKLIEEVQADAAGQLVERRNGDLDWHDAEHRRNLPTTAELSANVVLRGMAWSTSKAGLTNDLELAYGTAPEGGDKPTVRVVDTASRSVLGRGPYEAKLDTRLATEADALDRARLIVGRRSEPWWQVPALRLNLLRTPQLAGQLVALLGVEHGDVVRVTGMPSTLPLTTDRLAVEGYTETVTPTDWQLALVVADLGLAGAPVRWDDLPADLTWDEVPAWMTWQTAARWQPDPDPRGRWDDQPGDLRWDSINPDLTWDTYPVS